MLGRAGLKQFGAAALAVLALVASAGARVVVPAQRLADSKPATLKQVIDINLTNTELMLARGELAVERRGR